MNKTNIIGKWKIEKYDNRNFALYDNEALVCVTVYKKGAEEVRRRFIGYESPDKGNPDMVFVTA